MNKNKHTIKIIMTSVLIIPLLIYLFSSVVFGGDITTTDPTYIKPPNDPEEAILTTDEPIHVEEPADPVLHTTKIDPNDEPIYVQDPGTIVIEEPANNTANKDVNLRIEPVTDPSTNSDIIDLTVTTKPGTTDVQYYVDDSSSDDTYLGAAEKDSNKEEWRLRVEKEKRLPDGEHDIYAKVRASDREYESERVRLRIERAHEEQRAKLKEDFGELDPNLDFDGDGLSNSDEKRLGTNPYLADTDNDGFIDGDEIRNGFNPLEAATGDKSDKITLETPREKGVVNENYKIKNVGLKKDGSGNKIVFSGEALPNTFVRIYIYSDTPIIVTVRTDSAGDWSYELDKELENGDHEVYVAVTDNTGKITSKSNPLAFVKTAQAISATPTASAAAVESPVEELGPNSIFYAIIIIVAVFAVSLVLIKTLMAHK